LHIHYKHLELKNLFSVVSHRRTEKKFNSILLFAETNLTLSKVNKNLIINKRRWDHSNVIFLNRQHICPVWWTVFQRVRIVLYFSSICFYLHVYEADFLQWLLRNKDRILANIFNSSVRYIDDVLSLNNSLFGD
jgi:hypothetical protein